MPCLVTLADRDRRGDRDALHRADGVGDPALLRQRQYLRQDDLQVHEPVRHSEGAADLVLDDRNRCGRSAMAFDLADPRVAATLEAAVFTTGADAADRPALIRELSPMKLSSMTRSGLISSG